MSLLTSVLALSLGIGAIQVRDSSSPRVLATGEGFAVALVQAPTESPGGNFVLSVQRAGVPESARRFVLTKDVVSVDDVSISRDLVVIVGATAGAMKALTVAEGTSGRVVFERLCRDVRLAQDQSRDFCSDSSGGSMVSFELATRQVRNAMTAVDGALHLLATGSIADKRKVVAALSMSKQLSGSTAVREALLSELAEEIARDEARARQNPAVQGIRSGGPERDYLGELVAAVARYRDRASLPLLVRADHRSSVGAIAAFGSEAVPQVLHSLEAGESPGYSLYYRSGLFESLWLILQRTSRLAPPIRARISQTVRSALRAPRSTREILEALAVVEELDDDERDDELVAYAENARLVQDRGIRDPEDLRRVQEKARSVLARRVTLP